MEYEPSVRCSKDPAEAVSRVAVRAVASFTDTEPTNLPPLATVTDPDALDALVSATGTDCRVSFVYYDHEITVETNDEGTEIAVHPTGE